MRAFLLTTLVGLLAGTVAGIVIPTGRNGIEERQLQPISTMVGTAGTSYIYALASPIPESIASQLAPVAPAAPTSTTGILSDGGAVSTVAEATPLATPPAVAGNYTPGYRNIGYYGTWFIYDRKFRPSDIIVSQWTHIMAGFWKIRDDGEIIVQDTNSDLDTLLLENPSTERSAVHGVFEQLYRIKNENRNLKVMLSVGGWVASEDGSMAKGLSTPEKRVRFASSAAKAVMDLGLDGIDFDWEYPSNEAETLAHTETIRLLRQELDSTAGQLGVSRKLELSMAAPVGPHNIKRLNLVELDKYLDFYNLMGYDMAGSAFSSVAGHHAAFFKSTDGSTEFALLDGLEMYLAAGISADTINILMPIYGHSFAGTDGPGKPFTGPGLTSWGETGGVPDYSEIPVGGENVLFEDEKILAAWTYNKQACEMVSFDTPKITKLKTEYIKRRGLGGIGFWGINGDKWTVQGNLVNTAIDVLGGTGAFEKFENHIQYAGSRYPNIRVYDGVKVSPGKSLVGTSTN